MSVARPVTRSVVRPVVRSVSGASGFSSMRADLTSTRLVRGVGSVTVPTIGDSDNDRYVLDFENIWRGVLAEEMRVYGARRVHNLIPAAGTGSASLAVAANKTMTLGAGTYIFSMGAGTGTATFSGTGGATGTLTANASNRTCVTKTITAGTLIVTASVASLVDLQVEEATGRSDTTTPSEYVPTGVATGEELVTNGSFGADSDWTKGTGWSIGSGVASCDGTQAGNTDITQGSAIAGATYLVEYTVTSFSAGFVRALIGGNPGTNRGGSGTFKQVITAVNTGAWGVRGNVDFVGSVDNISVKRINHGVNVDGVNVFTTTNGNSVASNVVTEGEGTRLTTVKGLMCEGAATELSGRSADLGNWTNNVTAAAVQDAIGLSGESSGAFTVTDSSAGAAQIRAHDTTIANDNGKIFMLARVGYNASPSVYPQIRLFLTGGTSVNQSLVLDPSDGSYTEPNTDGTVEFVHRDGEWWYVLLSCTNNTSGNTTARELLTPAYNADGTTTADVTAQGSTVFASCELYKDTWSYSPILSTGGTAKTRNSDTDYLLDVANWPAGDVSVEFELTPLFDTALSAADGIITPNSTTAARTIFFASAIAKRLVLGDGTGAIGFSNAWANPGDTITVKFRANTSTSKMQFAVDRAAGAEGNFDGSFDPSTAIALFKDLTQGACIKNLHIYSTDLGNNWLEAS